jgi:GDPmannose 4,6-dehydratase
MKKALITGITGQDGSYLAEYLISKGYEVHGIVRRASTPSFGRLTHMDLDVHHPQTKLYLHYGDLADSSHFTNLFYELEPDEVYNLGAQSHVRVSFDVPDYTGDVTGLATVRLLEAIRKSGIKTKFYQASSSEMFGSTPPPQNEDTKFHPRSPYAIAKMYSYWTTVNYREAYDIFACNGILFNHESPRRGFSFVTRKITISIAKLIKGELDKLYLGNLDARRDWGYAPEYVEAMYLMLQQDKPQDFVIGTGKSYSVREFLEKCFNYAGIEIEWTGNGIEETGIVKSCKKDDCLKIGQEIVGIDPYYYRPAEVDYLLADIAKAKSILNWEPKIDIDVLVKVMMDCDLDAHGLETTQEGKKIVNSSGFGWTNNLFERL